MVRVAYEIAQVPSHRTLSGIFITFLIYCGHLTLAISWILMTPTCGSQENSYWFGDYHCLAAHIYVTQATSKGHIIIKGSCSCWVSGMTSIHTNIQCTLWWKIPTIAHIYYSSSELESGQFGDNVGWNEICLFMITHSVRNKTPSVN